MLSIVPTAGDLKWTVLFNAVDTSERLKIPGVWRAALEALDFADVSPVVVNAPGKAGPRY